MPAFHPAADCPGSREGFLGLDMNWARARKISRGKAKGSRLRREILRICLLISPCLVESETSGDSSVCRAQGLFGSES